MTLESKVETKESVFVQEVDEEMILLDADTQEYFSLNEIGSYFYELLAEKKELALVLEELKNSFDVSEEDLKRDLFAFVKALEEKKLIKLL